MNPISQPQVSAPINITIIQGPSREDLRDAHGSKGESLRKVNFTLSYKDEAKMVHLYNVWGFPLRVATQMFVDIEVTIVGVVWIDHPKRLMGEISGLLQILDPNVGQIPIPFTGTYDTQSRTGHIGVPPQRGW